MQFQQPQIREAELNSYINHDFNIADVVCFRDVELVRRLLECLLPIRKALHQALLLQGINNLVVEHALRRAWGLHDHVGVG